jgi:hypothetical protein
MHSWGDALAFIIMSGRKTEMKCHIKVVYGGHVSPEVLCFKRKGYGYVCYQ